MKASDIIKQAMKETRTTQVQLVEQLGVNHQSSVSVRINSDNPLLGNFVEIIDALGYEVVVQPKKRGRRPAGQEVVTL